MICAFIMSYHVNEVKIPVTESEMSKMTLKTEVKVIHFQLMLVESLTVYRVYVLKSSKIGKRP